MPKAPIIKKGQKDSRPYRPKGIAVASEDSLENIETLTAVFEETKDLISDYLEGNTESETRPSTPVEILKEVRLQTEKQVKALDNFIAKSNKRSHVESSSDSNREIDRIILSKTRKFTDSFEDKLEKIETMAEESLVHRFETYGTATAENEDRAPIDIVAIYTANLRHLKKLSDQEIGNMIVKGASLSKEIKAARADKKTMLGFKNFILHISENTDFIGRMSLTKARFMAILHRHAHLEHVSSLTMDEQREFSLSPLIHKFLIEDSPLSNHKHLLGSGFQYQWREFGETTKQGVFKFTEAALFIAGCVILDYLSDQMALVRDNLRPVDIVDWIQKPESITGNTMTAGFRNMAGAWTELQNKDEVLNNVKDILELCQFDFYRSEAKKETSRIYKGLQEKFTT